MKDIKSIIRGFCFVITKPWSSSWRIVIVENIDSRCAWCLDLHTVVFKMAYISESVANF